MGQQKTRVARSQSRADRGEHTVKTRGFQQEKQGQEAPCLTVNRNANAYCNVTPKLTRERRPEKRWPSGSTEKYKQRADHHSQNRSDQENKGPVGTFRIDGSRAKGHCSLSPLP